VAKFEKLCMDKILANAFVSLPESKAKEFVEKSVGKTPKEMEALVVEYFSEEIYNNLVGKTIGNLIHDYLKTILPQCSEEQKQKIAAHMASLNVLKD
jgi:hypothetical protein